MNGESKITYQQLIKLSNSKRVNFIYSKFKIDLIKLAHYWEKHWASLSIFEVEDAVFYSLTFINEILDKYDENSKLAFDEYILSALSSRIVNFYRSVYKYASKSVMGSDYFNEVISIDPWAQKDIENKAHNAHFKKYLEQEYRKLSTVEKAIFKLFIKGYSYTQVVQTLRIPRRPIRKIMKLLVELAHKIS